MKLFRQSTALICIIASFIAHAGGSPADKAKGAANQSIVEELQRLQGTWGGVMVGQEQGGNITVTINGNSLHFHRDTNFWFETTFTLPVGTHPKQLHTTIRECAPGQGDSVGKEVVAIYKIEDGTLTLVALGGGDGAPPKSFEAAEVKGLSRYELRKLQPPKKNADPKKSK